MSELASAWAWKQIQGISPTAFFVLLAIARTADKNGSSDAYVSTLASLTGYTVRQVQRHLRALEQANKIRTVRRAGRPSTYQLAVYE